MLRATGRWLLNIAGLLLVLLGGLFAWTGDSSARSAGLFVNLFALAVLVAFPTALGLFCLFEADLLRTESRPTGRTHYRILFAVGVLGSLVVLGFALHLIYQLTTRRTHVGVSVLFVGLALLRYYANVYRPWLSTAAAAVRRSGIFESVVFLALKGIFYLLVEIVFMVLTGGPSGGSIRFGGGSSGGGGTSGRW